MSEFEVFYVELERDIKLTDLGEVPRGAVLEMMSATTPAGARVTDFIAVESYKIIKKKYPCYNSACPYEEQNFAAEETDYCFRCKRNSRHNDFPS